jgi:hypothetical protein
MSSTLTPFPHVTPTSLLADLLKTPDDLHKLPSIRKKLVKEKVQLDAKLNASVKSQLDATRDGLRRLQVAKAQVAMVKEEMIGIEKMKEGRVEDEVAFSKISKVRTMGICISLSP